MHDFPKTKSGEQRTEQEGLKRLADSIIGTVQVQTIREFLDNVNAPKDHPLVIKFPKIDIFDTWVTSKIKGFEDSKKWMDKEDNNPGSSLRFGVCYKYIGEKTEYTDAEWQQAKKLLLEDKEKQLMEELQQMADQTPNRETLIPPHVRLERENAELEERAAVLFAKNQALAQKVKALENNLLTTGAGEEQAQTENGILRERVNKAEKKLNETEHALAELTETHKQAIQDLRWAAKNPGFLGKKLMEAVQKLISKDALSIFNKQEEQQ